MKVKLSKVVYVLLVALLAINMIGSKNVSANGGSTWVKNGKELLIGNGSDFGIIYTKKGNKLFTVEFEEQYDTNKYWVSAYGYDREFGLSGSVAMKMIIKKNKIVFKYNDGSYDIGKRIKGTWKLKDWH